MDCGLQKKALREREREGIAVAVDWHHKTNVL